MADSTEAPAAEAATSKPSPQFNVRLRTTEDTELPKFANFASVQGDARHVILDFGFIEPAAGAAAARTAGNNSEVPHELPGRLSCRMVVGLDVAAQLSQQINSHLRTITARRNEAGKTEDEKS